MLNTCCRFWPYINHITGWTNILDLHYLHSIGFKGHLLLQNWHIAGCWNQLWSLASTVFPALFSICGATWRGSTQGVESQNQAIEKLGALLAYMYYFKKLEPSKTWRCVERKLEKIELDWYDHIISFWLVSLQFPIHGPSTCKCLGQEKPWQVLSQHCPAVEPTFLA